MTRPPYEGFGVRTDAPPSNLWLARIAPRGGYPAVALVERDVWADGRVEDVVRAQFGRNAWAVVRDPVAAHFNRRLREAGQPGGRWRTETPLDRLLGKELCALAWGVEGAAADRLPEALRRWLGLTPEELWWLFARASQSVAWRKALRVVLTEGEPPRSQGEDAWPGEG